MARRVAAMAYHASKVVIEDSDFAVNTLFSRNDVPGLRLNVSYHNYTGRDLTVVDRCGVAHKLAGRMRTQGLNASLYVSVTYDAYDRETVILDRPEISDSDRNYRNFSLARATRSVTPPAYGRRTVGGESVTVVYEISDEQLLNSQAVYYRNLDVVVSLSDCVPIPKHPYEFTGALSNEILKTDGLLDNDEFRLGILLVDNNGRVGPRFVNVNGRLFRVPAARRNNLRDGVYLKTSECVLGDTGLPPPAAISFYTFEDYATACKDDITLLKLFTSIDQARSLGDMQTARKAELEEIAYNRRLEEEAWRKEKAKDDREKASLQLRLDEQNEEFARSKREWERRNDELNRQRKDLEHQMDMQKLQHAQEVQNLKHQQTMQKMDREREEKNGWNVTAKDVAVMVAGITALATAVGGLYKLYKSYDKE